MDNTLKTDYEVRLATLKKLGGDMTKKYASIYEVDLAILDKTGQGGGEGGGLTPEQEALLNSIVNKVEQVRLVTDGKSIRYEGSFTPLTFDVIYSLVMDNSKYVYVVMDNNIRFRPSAYDGDAIWFDSSFIEEGTANILRCIINKSNKVSIDQIEVASKSDIPSLEGYALKTDIPSLDGYAKLTDIPSVPTKVSELENDSHYLTEHQSLDEYVKKSEIPTKTSELENDSNFLTEHQKLKTINGESIVGEGNIEISGEGGVTIEQVDREIESKLVGYAKEEDIPTVPTKTSELTNDSGFLTEHQSLEGYATESWVEGKGYLTEHQSLDEYAKKSEIPSVDGLASEQWVNEQGFLKEHQDLSEYAKKSEIPTVPTKVSQLENDENYAKKSEVPNIFVGTQAQWDALSDEQKNTYTLSLITE